MENRLWKRLLAVGLLLGSTQVAIQLGGAQPAQAVSFAPQRYTATTAANGSQSKTIDVYCPVGWHVLGGGGEANDGGTRDVMLTELRPVFSSEDYFEVTAKDLHFVANWSLTGYAICGVADPLLIVSSSSVPRAATAYQILQVSCPSGYHGIGAGGAVTGADNLVGLQLVRPTDDLRSSWASGRADPTYYVPDLPAWSVTAYLICAVNYPVSARYVGQVANTYAASVGCPTGQYTFGAGAGGNTHDSGGSYLRSIVPTPDLDGVTSTMTSTPLGGGMVAVATCGVA